MVNFSMLPPEINSARLFSGAGSAPMIAAADGLDMGCADEFVLSGVVIFVGDVRTGGIRRGRVRRLRRWRPRRLRTRRG